MSVRWGYGGIVVGDLVLPIDEKECLFSEPDDVEVEEEPIEVIWEDVPGLVVEVMEYEPRREYYQVRVVVGDVVGWTCSEYIRVVSGR